MFKMSKKRAKSMILKTSDPMGFRPVAGSQRSPVWRCNCRQSLLDISKTYLYNKIIDRDDSSYQQQREVKNISKIQKGCL